MNDSINILLPSKPQYVSVARLTASYLASQMGFDIEAIEDIKLAVGEACNNAVLHSGENTTYQLDLKTESQTLVIEVKDTGKGFDTSHIKNPAIDELQENGLGLFIIKSLMDDVEIVTQAGQGTKIIMKKTME